ncbi:glycosyltransferase family 39 protein [Candidatus Gottesmanbacteria bacterium]|nr:glycosyltransferase family 39 protein [Candidatus Gottesmanbacteria bacterium]
MKKRFDIFIAVIFSFVFFAVGLSTLSHYGISWDDPAHYVRGKAYLTYFLSPLIGNSPQLPRRSMYQLPNMTAQYWRFNDSGHPPLNGILFAAANTIFYEVFGVLGDIEAYSVFGIFLSSLFIGILVWFAIQEIGILAGIVSGLSLFLYPIFLAETHFNVKDPPLTVFFSIAVLLFYRAVTKNSRKLLVFSGIAWGFALATKLNSAFLPIIAGLWFLYYWLIQRPERKRNLTKIIVLFPFAGVIAVSLFFLSWPFLWTAPIEHLKKILGYYVSIGTYQPYQPAYLFFGFNSYPLAWIGLTTPLVILALGGIGFIAAFAYTIRRTSPLGTLLILWMTIPIVRASMPGTSIYGGARLLMEYIPAFCLLAGYGARFIVWRLTGMWRVMILILIFAGFVIAGAKLIRIHPNETLYVNELIGGLRGAYALRIPSAGEDLGSVYRQGAQWLNQYAEQGARLTLVHRGTSALPRPFLRSDIIFDDSVWSGYAHRGEYIMEATSMDFEALRYFEPAFLERFLKPVYEVRVDGTTVLTIWKNDPANIKSEYRNQQMEEVAFALEGKDLIIRLLREVKITKLELIFDNDGCIPPENIKIGVSSNGDKWFSPYFLITQMGDGDRSYTLGNTSLSYSFPADKASMIGLFSEIDNVCPIVQVRRARVWFLDSGAGNSTSSSPQ